MAGDRLTGLDASFLHLEDASSHMHVAWVMLFEGPPPPYDELLDGLRAPAAARAALPPAARVRPARPGPAEVGRRPAPQPALPRALHRAAVARLRGPAAGPGRPGVLPAARPRQAALGGMAGRGARGRSLRGALQDPPRARRRDLRRGHHVRAVRHLARSRPLRTGPGDRWLPRPLPSAAQLLGEALVERATDPDRARPHACAPSSAARAASWRRARDAAVGVGAMAWAGLNPAPASPYNKPIGPHRRFTWVRADLQRRQGDQGRARRHGQRRGAGHRGGRAGRHLRRRGQNTDGLELKAMVPVSVREDIERGALGNRSPR